MVGGPARLAALHVELCSFECQGTHRSPIANRRVSTLRPEMVRVAMARWRESGATVSVVSGRFRVLRSAVGWAQSESIIDRNPLRDMRGPPRPGTRLHVPVADVASLIELSERLVEKAAAAVDGSTGSLKSLHKAEQIRLLMRLGADSGARRGELAALRFSDLDERVLTIERGVSGEQVWPPNTTRSHSCAPSSPTLAISIGCPAAPGSPSYEAHDHARSA
jgi:integrase